MGITFTEHQLYQTLCEAYFLFFFSHFAFSNEDTNIQRSHMTPQSQHSEGVTHIQGCKARLPDSLQTLYFANYIIVRCFKDRK